MRVAVSAAVFAAFVAPWASSSDCVRISTVLRPGDPVPGMAGFTMSGVGDLASINDNGVMLYAATITGEGVTTSNNHVLIGGALGSRSVIARERDPVHGLAGYIHLPPSSNHSGFSNLIVMPTGEVGFVADVAPEGTATIVKAILSGTVGATTPALFETGPAPGFPSDQFQFFAPAAPMIGGGVALMHGQARPVTNQHVLWAGSGGGGVMPQLQTGLQAPGLEIGVNLQLISNDSLVMNTAGRIGFHATLALGGSVNAGNRVLFYEGPADQLEVLSRAGDPVPGLPGAVYTTLRNTSLRMNNAGAVCFQSTVTGGGTGEVIVSKGAGQAFVLAKNGDPVPGLPGVTLTQVSNGRIDINGLGRVAFTARLSGAPSNADSAIFIGDPSGIEMVLREGDPLPGGFVAPDLGAATWFFNDRNQFVFIVTISDRATLFATRPNGEFVLLARANSLFSTGDGFVGVVGALVPWRFDAGARAAGSGRPTIFDNTGRLILSMFFTGSTGSGVFLFDIDDPCPADLDCNFLLDLADINAFVQGFSGQTPAGDLNGDGLWDLTDIGIFVASFTGGCV